jgi:CubicO group peptidase (beta-lactamase class C family)
VSVVADRYHAHLFTQSDEAIRVPAAAPASKLPHISLEVAVKRTRLPLLFSLLSSIAWAGSAAGQAAPAVSAGQASAPRQWQAALVEIDSFVAEQVKQDAVGSVTIGIVSGSNLVWTRTYGMADTEARRPATRESVYRVGSVTKQFTALMLLQLVEQGKVHLGDPVTKYVPEFQPPALYAGMPVPTLAQLATMTSGVAREPTGPADHSTGPVSGWQEKVFLSLPFVKYAHEPDTKFLYSNIGYATLGVALGRAAGQPFTTWIEQKILSPLGMQSSGWDATAAMRPHLTRAYEIGRDGKVDGEASVREHAGRGYRVPNGGLYSTVDDLARFVSWELGFGPEGILKRDTQTANYANLNTADGDLSSGYGVGFMATRRGNLVVLGHGGSTAGYRSAAHFHRRSKTGVIVLASVAGGKVNVGGIALRAFDKLAVLQEQPAAAGGQP